MEWKICLLTKEMKNITVDLMISDITFQLKNPEKLNARLNKYVKVLENEEFLYN